jgi:UDP-4-amino-4,6-dideoxy-N-acetyl-beta-L-altrosamine transaminase
LESNNKYIPYGHQYIDSDDISAVVDVLKSDWLTTGPKTKDFEAMLSEITDAKFAISCSSGTAALHLSMLAAGIGEGDAVIVPSITFASSANAVRFVGAEVIFSDVDKETGLLTEEGILNALNLNRNSLKIKAVLPVHLNGQCVDYEKIYHLANDNDLMIIEDASHAIGTGYLTSDNKKISIGSCDYSSMTNFSFHPVKTIAAGEGGAVTTNSKKLAEKLFRFRNHGITRNKDLFFNKQLSTDEKGIINPWYYEIQDLGYNYRLSDIHSALALSQLNKLSNFIEKRRFLVNKYDEYFKEASSLIHPITRVRNCNPAWHLYVVLIDFESLGIPRATVINRLTEEGIGSQVHYIPLHWQPYYINRYGKINLVGSESYYSRCLSLPLHISMQEKDIIFVVEKLVNILQE